MASMIRGCGRKNVVGSTRRGRFPGAQRIAAQQVAKSLGGVHTIGSDIQHMIGA